MLAGISALLSQSGTNMSLFSAFPFPNRKERALDSFQKDAWKAINAEPNKPFIRKEIVDGKTMVRVGIADKMVAQGCVNCHNTRADTPKNDWKLGDVRGVLEVSTFIDDQIAAGALLSKETAAGVILFGAIVIALLMYLVTYYVGRPVKRLSGVMSEMANGNEIDTIPGTRWKDELGIMARSLEVWKLNRISSAELENNRIQNENKAQEAERYSATIWMGPARQS